MSTIKPTIGRKVWLYVSTDLLGLPSAPYTGQSKLPFDATIVHVNLDGSINVTFSDHIGRSGAILNVPIYDPKESDSHMGGGSHYATWMPYQKGQAAKADATALELGAAARAAGPSVAY